MTQARAQSPLVLTEFPMDALMGRDPADLAPAWRKTPPPGVVIDAGPQRLSDAIAQWMK